MDGVVSVPQSAQMCFISVHQNGGGDEFGARASNNPGRTGILPFEFADVRFGSKADISQRSIYVRFTPESGHQSWLGLRSRSKTGRLALFAAPHRVGNFAARGCKAC